MRLPLCALPCGVISYKQGAFKHAQQQSYNCKTEADRTGGLREICGAQWRRCSRGTVAGAGEESLGSWGWLLAIETSWRVVCFSAVHRVHAGPAR